MKLSKRSQQITQSDIRAMTRECARAQGINMAQGICDLDVPESIINGAITAVRQNHNSYTACEGLMDLRKAISAKMDSFYNLSVSEENIIVSIGATGAFYSACLALLDPGDEVIVFEPFYGYHTATLSSLGCSIRYIRLAPPNWSFTIQDLTSSISPKTKAVLINTPSNPSGKVFSEAELTIIANFVSKHDLLVISDEIYESFVYKGSHIPPMSIPGLHERTVTISGFSKIFSITGWRLGYAICPPEVSAATAHFNDLVYICAPAPLQVGVSKGLLELGPEYYSNVQAEHLSKRNQFCQALEHAKLTPHVPQGAYYVLADISRVPGNDDKEKVLNILERTGVASVPGSAFYYNSPHSNVARFCFAKKQAELDNACERITRLSDL